MMKYAHLAGLSSPEPFRGAVLADHAFLIAVPMWIVAFVITLVGHAVFPDETDFRVLMALPVTRPFVFGAKLLAVVLFGGLFVIASHVALAPLLLLTAFGPWTESSFAVVVAAHWTASVLASATAAMAIIASQGVLMLGAPRGRLAGASAALRSLLLFVLVVSLPLLLRIPMVQRAFAAGEPWLAWIPPVWFLGLERWLMGDERALMLELAALASLAAVVVAAITAASYAVLYRTFDRTTARAGDTQLPFAAAQGVRRISREPRDPVGAAIRTFVRITLRRSVMHQGIVVALSAVGAGLVVNSLITADVGAWIKEGVVGRRLVEGVFWVPFPLIFVSVLAVRTALLVPVEQRANWIFRIIEQGAGRVEQLSAATSVVFVIGVLGPALLLLPLQWLVTGPGAIAACGAALVVGWLFVEIVMQNWDRIPFTCSFIPGKGFLPQTILLGLFSFVLFTTLGWALAQSSASGHRFAIGVVAVVAAITYGLSRRRRRAWAHTPLAFEDYVPSEINALKLLD